MLSAHIMQAIRDICRHLRHPDICDGDTADITFDSRSTFAGLGHTCRGVPDSAHLYLEVSAKTARAVEQRRSLMLCASSRTTLLHLTCLCISSIQSCHLPLLQSAVLQSFIAYFSLQMVCCRAAAILDAVCLIQNEPPPPHLLVCFHSLTYHSFLHSYLNAPS